MQVSVEQKNLLPVLVAAVRNTAPSSAIRALSGVRLTVNGGAELAATDTQTSVRLPLQLTETPDGEGNWLLPGRLFLEVVKSLPKTKPIVISDEGPGNSVTVVGGSARFTVQRLRGEDFPGLPAVLSGEDDVALPSTLLTGAIKAVIMAAGSDETRPILTGVHLIIRNNILTAVATDSYRMAVAKAEALGITDMEATIPARALAELSTLIDAYGDEEVRVTRKQNQVVFTLGQVTLTSNLISGQFPDYTQLIPKPGNEIMVKIQAREVAEMVRRAALMTEKKQALRLAFREGTLTVSSAAADMGSLQEVLPVPWPASADLDIGFAPAYLQAVLDCGIEELDVSFINATRPATFRAPDASFEYLLMPINLNVGVPS